MLDKSLADGGHAPKWHPQSRVGIYLGYSRNHARSVAWVLISAQYHVTYDDVFPTVAATSDTDK
eukprot:10421260-Ditylum_brightwellii.AAC.1